MTASEAFVRKGSVYVIYTSMFKSALPPSKKGKEKGVGGSQHSSARTEATEKWAVFYFNNRRAHPTTVLLVVPQRGPHSHLSDPLCSSFILLGIIQLLLS